MKIEGSGRVETSNVRRLGRPGGSSSFSVSSASEQPRAQTVTGPSPLAALDSILTLQNVDDPGSGRSKGLTHGENLLNLLDEVRDGLLMGGIPRATLNRLAGAVTRRHDTFADPKLQGVLDEIELRARVELAKLEFAEARVA